MHRKQPSHFIFFSWRPSLLGTFAGNETYRNTVNTPIYNIDNFSQDSGPRCNTCHLDQDFYMNPRVSRPRLQTRGYITNAMQCNKSLIKVLKLFLIFQFSTKDYIAKTQVYTSVFETFTQYCNNHSVQLVTSMHSDHLPLVMTAIVPDSAGCRSMLVHGWCSRRRRLTAKQILHTAIQYIDALRLTWGVDCRYLASKKITRHLFYIVVERREVHAAC